MFEFEITLATFEIQVIIMKVLVSMDESVKSSIDIVCTIPVCMLFVYNFPFVIEFRESLRKGQLKWGEEILLSRHNV